MPRKILLTASAVFGAAALTLTTLAVLALPAGAASCSKTLNVNLGAGCAGIASLTLLDADTNAGGTTCTDAGGCADVESGSPTAPAPVVRHRPVLAPIAPKAETQAPVVRAPRPAAAIVPAYRINRFDAAGNDFGSGFSLHLPYPAELFNRPVVSPVAPSAGAGGGWQIPMMPVELAASIIGGLMLLASAGGVRRMMAGV